LKNSYTVSTLPSSSITAAATTSCVILDYKMLYVEELDSVSMDIARFKVLAIMFSRKMREPRIHEDYFWTNDISSKLLIDAKGTKYKIGFSRKYSSWNHIEDER